jgi:hypothetical protein
VKCSDAQLGRLFRAVSQFVGSRLNSCCSNVGIATSPSGLPGTRNLAVPIGQDRLVSIFLATMAVRQQSRVVRLESAAELLETFGLANGGQGVPPTCRRIRANLRCDDLLRSGFEPHYLKGRPSGSLQFFPRRTSGTSVTQQRLAYLEISQM